MTVLSLGTAQFLLLLEQEEGTVFAAFTGLSDERDTWP